MENVEASQIRCAHFLMNETITHGTKW